MSVFALVCITRKSLTIVSSSRTLAWRSALASQHWGAEISTIAPGFLGETSQLLRFRFPALHKAYLGISSKLSFEEALHSTPRSAMNDVDASSRTVLHWACARGDYSAVKKLLSCGADPERPDMSENTPLHFSSYAGDLYSMEILLQARADVNRKDRVGQTALSIVCSKDLTETSALRLARMLTEYGADIDCMDSSGWRPLMFAAFIDQSTVVSFLLDRGAKVNSRTNNGESSLSLSVFRNSHECLKLLLAQPSLDFTSHYFFGETLLHQACYGADIETLCILQNACLVGLDVDAISEGETALEVAQRRRDDNRQWMDSNMKPPDKDPYEWYVAFEALVESIRKANRAVDDTHENDEELENSTGSIDDSIGEADEFWEDAPESPTA